MKTDEAAPETEGKKALERNYTDTLEKRTRRSTSEGVKLTRELKLRSITHTQKKRQTSVQKTYYVHAYKIIHTRQID